MTLNEPLLFLLLLPLERANSLIIQSALVGEMWSEIGTGIERKRARFYYFSGANRSRLLEAVLVVVVVVVVVAGEDQVNKACSFVCFKVSLVSPMRKLKVRVPSSHDMILGLEKSTTFKTS